MSQNKDKMSEIDEHIMKRFEIQKRLGKGAYGIVWKAVDRKTKDIVAVKKIFDAFRNQTDAQRTFREIMFLQSFKHHPNIIKLHSIHRAANNRDIYLGFEYMETDLHNVIKRGNILKDVHKRYIMYQLLKATKYIHSGNVIHRDQKPSNVLLDTLCRCKIADFGLARSLSSPGLDSGTESSDTAIVATAGGDDTTNTSHPLLTDYVATRWYRAPEILIANRRYTKGIDMWSLGCILAEMCAGRPVFPGTSTVDQVEKIMCSIPYPSQEDINAVCLSGSIGSAMIRNAAASSQPHTPLVSLLEGATPNDAVHLLERLLVFNPLRRLTAEDALRHTYVAKFHDAASEVRMESHVEIPLRDDVRLSVDDYRNKLYELMTSHHHHHKPPPPTVVKSTATTIKLSSEVNVQHQRRLALTKDTKSEPKLSRSSQHKQLQQQRHHLVANQQPQRHLVVGNNQQQLRRVHNVATTTLITPPIDGVTRYQQQQLQQQRQPVMQQVNRRSQGNNNQSGDYHHHHQQQQQQRHNNSLYSGHVTCNSSSELRHTGGGGGGNNGSNSHPRTCHHNLLPIASKQGSSLDGATASRGQSKKAAPSVGSGGNNHNKGGNLNYLSFNSFNRNHGIITQSALMELRANGIR